VSKAQNLLGLAPLMGSKWTYAIGSFVALVFVFTNYKIITSVLKTTPEAALTNDFPSTVNQIGKLLIKDHVLAFELSSVLLLGALVGAAIIARPKKEG